MTRRGLWRGLHIAVSAAAALVLVACSRRAPGPDECVAFAEMRFGHDFQTLAASPELKSLFDQLVITCLTASFDRRVFVCSTESRAPMECLRRYEPELFAYLRRYQPELFGNGEPLLPRQFRREAF